MLQTGKGGVRPHRIRKESSTTSVNTGAEEGTGGTGLNDRTLRDKDINSICNSDTGAESDKGNGNNGDNNRGRKTKPDTKESSNKEGNRSAKTLQELPVYLGGSNIIISNTTVGPKNENNKVATNGNGLQYRRCCFFWTCCCRCSCLNIKHHNPEHLQNKGNNRIGLDHLNGENEPLPSIEEVRLWAESFDRLMKCTVGRKAFREFLKCEYSEENILFWQACEDLKKERNPSLVEEKARLIYEDYISILSPKEVSLDSRVREAINRNMVEPTQRTFDEAQTQIYTLMHRDSYPRFINSSHYKRLAQLNNNGSGSSAGLPKETTS